VTTDEYLRILVDVASSYQYENVNPENAEDGFDSDSDEGLDSLLDEARGLTVPGQQMWMGDELGRYLIVNYYTDADELAAGVAHGGGRPVDFDPAEYPPSPKMFPWWEG
jgi:hypothetical protein